MADCDDLQVPDGHFLRMLSFDDIENAKFVQPEFPCSDDIGPKLFLSSGFCFGVDFQMGDDSGHDNPLIAHSEIFNVALSVFRERDFILHGGIVSKKPEVLKALSQRLRAACGLRNAGGEIQHLVD